MGLVLVTPPAVEPISTAAAKLQCRVDHADEDTLIDTYIAAARGYVEQMTGRALITQTWEYTSDSFTPSGVIRLGRSPLQTITYVKYYNSAGVLTTVASADYFADVSLPLGELTLAYGAYWPSPRSQRNAVTVRFVAGYGDDPENVPAGLRAAMLLMVAHMYTTREAFITGTIIQDNPAMQNLMAGFVTTLVA